VCTATGNCGSGPPRGARPPWARRFPQLQPRSDLDDRDFATFAYRPDSARTGEEDYVPYGDSYRLEWSAYRGSRIGLFSFNDLIPDIPTARQAANGGAADFREFRYRLR
jgi:hypothetical protein